MRKHGDDQFMLSETTHKSFGDLEKDLPSLPAPEQVLVLVVIQSIKHTLKYFAIRFSGGMFFFSLFLCLDAL